MCMLCRVDGVIFSGQQNGISLADMASAAVSGQQESSLGTAVYLLASLFNHSCSPNLDVNFPVNNSEPSTLSFWVVAVSCWSCKGNHVDITMLYQRVCLKQALSSRITEQMCCLLPVALQQWTVVLCANVCCSSQALLHLLQQETLVMANNSPSHISMQLQA